MTAYTVEVQETNVVFVPHASHTDDAARQAREWIEAHATGDVRVSGAAERVPRGAEGEARLLADVTVTEA